MQDRHTLSEFRVAVVFEDIELSEKERLGGSAILAPSFLLLDIDWLLLARLQVSLQ